MIVVAIVFMSIFGLCSLIGIPMYSAFWMEGAKEWISFLIFIQYGSLILTIILIVMGVNNKNKLKQNLPEKIVTPQIPKPSQSIPKPDDDEIDYMDEMLND